MLASIIKSAPILNVSQAYSNTSSDLDLVASFQATRDEKIIAILFDRYKHLVLGVCLKYEKKIEVCRDLMMNIFEDLIEELPNQNIKNFKNWLYTITRNKCLRHLKDELKTVSLDDEDNIGVWNNIQSNSSEFGYSEGYNHVEFGTIDRDKVHDALQTLNSAHRECIFKFYFEKLTYKQIEEQTNYTLKQVRSNIQNGKRNLKLALLETLRRDEDRDPYEL